MEEKTDVQFITIYQSFSKKIGVIRVVLFISVGTCDQSYL